jgi:geranylgeranyl diphosphate synthase type I
MRQEIKKYFGDPDLDADGVSIVQEVITSSGARQKLESMIDQLTKEALRAADNELISEQADSLLRELAKIATKRSS